MSDARVVEARAAQHVGSRYGAASVALTDSGTSALVLALRLTVPYGGTVAFPGYACVDLAAAARLLGVRVRLYDLDPRTLSPDLESVAQVLRRGVDAIVVAHLFAYPADVTSVRALAMSQGIPVIEDAAQGSGGVLHGARLGSLGDLAVLSFGRGKGLCAGGGGAVLGLANPWTDAVRNLELPPAGRGWSALASTGAQWALGRPSLYMLPSSLPWLRLGQMVYHPAHEPQRIAAASSSLVESAFGLEAAEVAHRRAVAATLDRAVERVPTHGRVEAIADATSGFLRYAVRDIGGRRLANTNLGIVKPYPRTVAEQPEIVPLLVAGEPPIPGSAELRRSLFTLPTHRLVNVRDVNALVAWIDDGSSG